MARHVSDPNGPCSGAFTSSMLRVWYVLEHKLGMYEGCLRYECKFMNKLCYEIMICVRLCMIVWCVAVKLSEVYHS